MASREAIASVLRMLRALYPAGDLPPDAPEAWNFVLPDVPDEELVAAARIAACEPGRKFIPTVGDIRAVLEAQRPKMDATTLLRQIEGMGSYNPHTGWCWPRVEDVRGKFGDAIASAYGMIGPGRLASDDATTRDIAARDFAQELKDVPVARQPQLPSGANPSDAVVKLAASKDAKALYSGSSHAKP